MKSVCNSLETDLFFSDSMELSMTVSSTSDIHLNMPAIIG